jgi:hypothetical protein
MKETSNTTNRRTIGLLIGAGMGLIYSLVSAFINPLLIRDLPLYSNSPANLSQIIWATLAGAVMGYIVNWPEAGLLGIIIASLLGSGTIFIETLIRATQTSGTNGLILFTFVYIILPLSVLFFPLTGLLRWVSGYFLQSGKRPWWKWYTLRMYLGLIILSISVGSLKLYSTEARASLHVVNDTIKLVQSSGVNKSPWGFRNVADSVYKADRHYLLDWTDDISRFPNMFGGEDNIGSSTFDVVLVYFKSGETVACLIRSTDANVYLCEQLK